MALQLNRREFVRCTTAGMAGVLGTHLVQAAATSRKPNVIVILADDMGSADAGFNGCRDIPTPHLDSLAKGGVRFVCGYVSHPFCSPTRAGLLTGRYQQRFGHENNPVYAPRDEKIGLPLDEVTLAQVLRQAGYVTGIVGKWHLGASPPFHPMRRGFDEQFGFLGGGHDYFKAGTEEEQREYFIPIQRNGKPVAESEYLTDAFSREAAAFVRRHPNKPFFLYLAYNAPHTPHQVREKYLGRFTRIEDAKRRNYAAMVSAMDDGVGLLLSALRELNLESDTLIFFLSDNGGVVGEWGHGSRNDPLRGGKGSVFEGGIRVPFVAQWRGHLPEGKVFDHPVSSLDIFPTAVAAAGAQLPADRKLDGVNLLPHLLGQTSEAPHERLFWRTGGGSAFAVREGRYKMLQIAAGGPELYDLESDLSEKTDLADARRDLVEKMLKAYEQWNKELMAPRWGNPAQGKKKDQNLPGK